MQHKDFIIGETFWRSDRQWRCTDIGTRTIIAIRIDSVQVGSTNPELRRTLGRAEAEAEGWFNGPPYACAERVFDEDDLPACSREPDACMSDAPNAGDAVQSGVELEADPMMAMRMVGIAQAKDIRERARAGGLRFEAYLPSELAGWVLDQIEDGTFIDPSEAVFVMLSEQHELEPHADLREEVVRRSCEVAFSDPRPGLSNEEVKAWLERLADAPRHDPAVWHNVTP